MRVQEPGWPVSRLQPTGAWAVLRQGDFVYLDGQGASPEGDRPSWTG